MRWLLRCASALLVLASGMGNAQAPDVKVALVIANDAYRNIAPLSNAVSDGELIAYTLSQAGFFVAPLGRNLDKATFEASLRDFKRKSYGADIALIYYAGHGVEFAGQNTLLPVDTRIVDPLDATTGTLAPSAREVSVQGGIPLSTVLGSIQRAKRLRVVVLDTCRTHPLSCRLMINADGSFVPSDRPCLYGLRSSQRLPPRTLVSYSTGYQQTASDGVGQYNSAFAASFAKRIVEPGLEVRTFFGKVRDDVIAANATSSITAVRSQRPEVAVVLGDEQVSLVSQ